MMTNRPLTYAHRVELDGAVLDNGTIVHVPPSVGMQYANLFRIAAPLAATGYGTANSYGAQPRSDGQRILEPVKCKHWQPRVAAGAAVLVSGAVIGPGRPSVATGELDPRA